MIRNFLSSNKNTFKRWDADIGLIKIKTDLKEVIRWIFNWTMEELSKYGYIFKRYRL